MPSNCQLHPPSTGHGWDEHNLSQLRYFRALSLREKLQAVEGMADVVRHFRKIRAQGGFKRASQQVDEPGAISACADREPVAPVQVGDTEFH